MNRRSKISVLIVILLVPAIIYTFLKIFGQNEYSLPVYDTDGSSKIHTSHETENLNSNKFHFHDLYDQKGQLIDMESMYGHISIIELVSTQVNLKSRNHKIDRIADIFIKEQDVQLLRIFEDDSRSTSLFDDTIRPVHDNISICFVEFDVMDKIAESLMVLDVDSNRTESFDHLVLIDRKQRIRGYYNLQDFEEIDRLILEIKILLNQKRNV
jgi:protein SCO1/2